MFPRFLECPRNASRTIKLPQLCPINAHNHWQSLELGDDFLCEKCGFFHNILLKHAVATCVPQEEIDIELPSGEEGAPVRASGVPVEPRQSLSQLVQRQARFLESLREVRTSGFLAATAQLCHLDTALAQHLWVTLMPRLWKVLSDKQQSVST